MEKSPRHIQQKKQGTEWYTKIASFLERQDRDFPSGAVVKNPPANAGNAGLHAAEQVSPCATTTEPTL